MNVDIKRRVDEVVAKIKTDRNFASKFSDDPAAAVKSLLDVNLSSEQVNAIVEGVKAKVSFDKGNDFITKGKGLF